ncbi:MAG: hypothetical protein AAF401_19425 [Pseudomonadota bacterium]
MRIVFASIALLALAACSNPAAPQIGRVLGTVGGVVLGVPGAAVGAVGGAIGSVANAEAAEQKRLEQEATAEAQPAD